MVKDAVALHSMFEGLFVRALHVDGPLKERLRASGFDIDRPLPRYPVAVWEACVDAAAEALYPAVARGEAWQRLGRRFIEGYFETLVGKLIAAALPFLSAKGFVNRAPRFITTGLEGARVALVWHDERRVTLHVDRAGELAGALMAGVMAVCFERMRVPAPRFEWRSDGPGLAAVTMTFAERPAAGA